MNLSMIKLHLTTMSTIRKVECILALLCIITLIIVMAFVTAAIAVGVVLILIIIVYIFRLWRYLPSERHHVQSVALAQQNKHLPSTVDSLPHLAHLPQSHIMINTDPYYIQEEEEREVQQNYPSEIYTNNEPFPSSFAVNNAHVAYPRGMQRTPQAPSIIRSTINAINHNNNMNNAVPVMTEDNAQLQYYQSASLLQQQQQQYLVLRNANRELSQQTVPAGTVYTNHMNNNNYTQVDHSRHVPYQIQWMPQSVPHSEGSEYQFVNNNNNNNDPDENNNDYESIPIMDNVNQEENNEESGSVNGCSDTCENENINNNGDDDEEEDEVLQEEDDENEDEDEEN